jgi:hypothetical protein
VSDALNRRPIGPTEGLLRTTSAMGHDGTVGGRSRLATPHGQVSRSSPRVGGFTNRGSGGGGITSGSHTIALFAADQTFAPAGTAVVWSGRRAAWRHHGFFQQTFPTSVLTVEILRYWRLDLGLVWDDWPRGAWVEVLIDGQVQWPRTLLAAEWATGVGPISLDLGVLPVGTTVEVLVSPGPAASGPKLAKRIHGSLVAVDPPGTTVDGAPGTAVPGVPTGMSCAAAYSWNQNLATERTVAVPAWEPGDVAVFTHAITNVTGGTFDRNPLDPRLVTQYDRSGDVGGRRYQFYVGSRVMQAGDDSNFVFGYSSSTSAARAQAVTVALLKRNLFSNGRPAFGSPVAYFAHDHPLPVESPASTAWTLLVHLSIGGLSIWTRGNELARPTIDHPDAVDLGWNGSESTLCFPAAPEDRMTWTYVGAYLGGGAAVLSSAGLSNEGRITILLPVPSPEAEL